MFWDLIVSMIRNGLTERLAVDRVYNVYGRGTSVTIIVNKLKQAKKDNNLHETLRMPTIATAMVTPTTRRNTTDLENLV